MIVRVNNDNLAQYEDFIKNIQTDVKLIIKEGDKTVEDADIIKTGQVLIVGNENYIIIVIGDCNGDGQADLKDILDINKHRLNKFRLTVEYLEAADVNGDGEVEIKDIFLINKFRLKKY